MNCVSIDLFVNYYLIDSGMFVNGMHISFQEWIRGAESKHHRMLMVAGVCLIDPNRVFHFMVPMADMERSSLAFVEFQFAGFC